jgi:MFS family permease
LTRQTRLVSRLGVLRDPDFGKLWLATTISQLGTQITVIAWPLVAILLLHAGPAELGILTAAETIPFLLIGLPAGVWIDRMRRRPVLIAADVARGLLLVSVPVAAFLGVLTMVQLYVVGFAVGFFGVFFEIGTTSYVPALLDRGQLLEGNQKLEAGRAVASVPDRWSGWSARQRPSSPTRSASSSRACSSPRSASRNRRSRALSMHRAECLPK